MRINRLLAGLLASLAWVTSPSVVLGQAQEAPVLIGDGAMEVGTRIWLDRGEGAVLQRGDRLRIYYEVEEDAFVTVFRVDTDGNVRLIHPAAPTQNNYARGGRQYRVLLPDSPYWLVDDAPGLGYFFIVASLEPFALTQLPFHLAGGWDLALVGRQVYGDPYEAMDDYVAAVLPDWGEAVFGLDFLTYSVGDQHEYPRFMCYQCHGFKAFSDWNPYRSVCTEFRVVIWDDPYYYPAARYGTTGAVLPRRARQGPRYEFKEAVAIGGIGAPVRQTRQAVHRGTGQAFGSPKRITTIPRREGTVPRVGGDGVDPRRGEAQGNDGAVLRPSVVNPGTGTRRSGVRSGFRRPSLQLPSRDSESTQRQARPRGQSRGTPGVRPTPQASPRPRGVVQPNRGRPRARPQIRPSPRPRVRRGRAVKPPARVRQPVREAPPRRTARPKKKKPNGGAGT